MNAPAKFTYLWTSQKNRKSEDAPLKHRGYVFFKLHPTLTTKVHIPNINLMNNVGVFKPGVTNNNKKSKAEEMYRQKGYNPFYVYIMARNIVNARKNEKNKSSPNTGHNKRLENWELIKGVSSNLIKEKVGNVNVNRYVNGLINRSRNNNVISLMKNQSIMGLKNLIPTYGGNTVMKGQGQGSQYYVRNTGPYNTLRSRTEANSRTKKKEKERKEKEKERRRKRSKAKNNGGRQPSPPKSPGTASSSRQNWRVSV
jgi:hypothetical protein